MKLHSKLSFLLPALAALLLALASPSLLAKTSPGDLDPSFNGGIPAVIDLNPSATVQPASAAVNPLNGDILWAGEFVTPPAKPEGVIVVYKPDGTLDTAVDGGSGDITLIAGQAGYSGGGLVFHAVAVDGEGRILAEGTVVDSGGTTAAMLLARFEPDGSLDTSFGAAGTGAVTDALNNIAKGSGGLSLTADGHILVTGLAADAVPPTKAPLTVWRFNSDGTADTGFGDNGHVQIAAIYTPGAPVPCFPALRPDGALIAGCQLPASGTWKLTRLNVDGTVDTGFGSSGFVTGAIGMKLAGVALAPDGGFVIGEADDASPPNIDLRRFVGDGSVDSGFNGGNPLGVGSLPGPLPNRLPLAVQPDGRVFIGINPLGGYQMTVFAFLPDGSFDTGFGSGGVATVNFSGIAGNNYTPYPVALRLQADGALVAAGYANSTAGSYPAAFVTRLVNDAYDLAPDAPAFKDVAPAPLGEAVASNAVAVAGVSIGSETSGISVALTAHNGKYSASGAGGPFAGGFTGTNIAWISAGDKLALEQMTPDTADTDTTTQVALGGFWAPNNYTIPLGAPAKAKWTTTTDQPPVAHDASLTATSAEPASGTLGADNPSGGTLAFTIVTQPTHGKVSLDDAAKGSFSYTSADGYSGNDSFTWKVNDGVADSNAATVTITVSAAPPPPPPPPSGGGGGGGLGALGLLALALLGLGAALLRRKHAR